MRPLLLTLLLMAITCAAQADSALAKLLAGAEFTPPLSGLQVSLLDGGEAAESLAYGFAQLNAEGPMPLLPEHKIR
ncbi:MAG: hypothetical protein VBE63_27710, partial [Lamprobacter sp.]|uniref:hypothetical protein n=1 Tax=Lamprobacter sp. TaxID=3100796 RepID=UPI002B2632C0